MKKKVDLEKNLEKARESRSNKYLLIWHRKEMERMLCKNQNPRSDPKDHLNHFIGNCQESIMRDSQNKNG